MTDGRVTAVRAAKLEPDIPGGYVGMMVAAADRMFPSPSAVLAVLVLALPALAFAENSDDTHLASPAQGLEDFYRQNVRQDGRVPSRVGEDVLALQWQFPRDGRDTKTSMRAGGHWLTIEGKNKKVDVAALQHKAGRTFVITKTDKDGLPYEHRTEYLPLRGGSLRMTVKATQGNGVDNQRFVGVLRPGENRPTRGWRPARTAHGSRPHPLIPPAACQRRVDLLPGGRRRAALLRPPARCPGGLAVAAAGLEQGPVIGRLPRLRRQLLGTRDLGARPARIAAFEARARPRSSATAASSGLSLAARVSAVTAA